jgi:hypothetical protein
MAPRLKSRSTFTHHILCPLSHCTTAFQSSTMVRHHTKGGKRKVQPVNPENEDLGRFAGSSDEEDERDVDHDDNHDDDDDSVDQEEIKNDEPVKKPPNRSRSQKADHEADRGDADKSGSSGEDSDAEEEKARGTAGMANAMARIMGVSKPAAGTQSVILSKTKTPLQRMAEKEKQEDKEIKEKRRANRERNLLALHVPLSVATTGTVVASDGASGNLLVQELEQERIHRRVATRGVVALFNAISQHQKMVTKPELPTTESISKSKAEVKKLTKHGFLDMIKSTATSKQEKGSTSNPDKPSADVSKSKPQWNALQDDFMLNAKKMKNWDQASSDEDDEDEEGGENMDGSSEEEEDRKAVSSKKAASSKRRKVGGAR